MFRLNPRNARGASHHLALMGNWPTIIHTFLPLSTQWKSSPSRKWGCGVSPKFHLAVFVFVVNQEKWWAGGVQDSPMVESFSTNPPAIESCWNLEFCQTSTTELLCESFGAPLGDWANGGYVDGLPHVWWVGFSFWGCSPILSNWCGIWAQNYVALFQENEKSGCNHRDLSSFPRRAGNT